MKIKALFALLIIVSICHTHNIHSHPRKYAHYTQTADVIRSDSWWDNASSLTQAAVIIGGVVGTYYAAKWIYNYFFALTDGQEIEQALSQLERASVFHNDLAFAYHNETTIVLPTLNLNIGNKYTSGVIELLKPEITAKYSHRPFYSYVVNLERDINTVAQKKSELSTAKIRLFERKIQLHKIDGRTMSNEQKEIYSKEYTQVIEKISATHDQLQTLHYILLEIRNYVVRTLEYSNESKQARIEQLERENAHLQSQAMAHTAAAVAQAYYYSKPTEPTQVTHVHIYQEAQDEDEQS